MHILKNIYEQAVIALDAIQRMRWETRTANSENIGRLSL